MTGSDFMGLNYMTQSLLSEPGTREKRGLQKSMLCKHSLSTVNQKNGDELLGRMQHLETTHPSAIADDCGAMKRSGGLLVLGGPVPVWGESANPKCILVDRPRTIQPFLKIKSGSDLKYAEDKLEARQTQN